MKVSLLDALRNGTRPDDRMPRNTQYLTVCQNASAGPFGIRPFRAIAQPITDAALTTALVTKSYPWPQLFKTRDGATLMDKSAMFSVTTSPSAAWTIGATTVYDFTTYNWDNDAASSLSLPTDGYDWHMVDLGRFQMFFNGKCVLFRAGFSAKVLGQDEVTITTGASYQDGRVFLGGFDSANVNALVNWDAYLDTLTGDFVGEAAKLTTTGMGANWVWWSSIGAPDALRFFSLDFMKFGSMASTPDTGYTAANPFWRTLAQRRESFACPMPTPGRVLKMAQLGSAMVVYSETGVHSLVPVETNEVSTFGLREIDGFGHMIGVNGGTDVRAAAGGNEQIQAFIDEANDLWILTPSGTGVKAEKRGFRHIFSTGTDWMVHYDASEREFHFSSDDRCYRLGETGALSRSNQIPTTVFFSRASGASSPIGIATNDSAISDFALVTTDWFDAGPDVKNPQLVRVYLDPGETDASLWSMTVLAKVVENGDKTIQKACPRPDARGVSQIDISGSAFKISMLHTGQSTAVMQNLEAEFDNGDRRKIATWLT